MTQKILPPAAGFTLVGKDTPHGLQKAILLVKSRLTKQLIYLGSTVKFFGQKSA